MKFAVGIIVFLWLLAGLIGASRREAFSSLVRATGIGGLCRPGEGRRQGNAEAGEAGVDVRTDFPGLLEVGAGALLIALARPSDGSSIQRC